MEPHFLQTAVLTTPPRIHGEPSLRKRAGQWAEFGQGTTGRKVVWRHWMVVHCQWRHRVLPVSGCGNPTVLPVACRGSKVGVQRSCEGAELHAGAAGEGGGGLAGDLGRGVIHLAGMSEAGWGEEGGGRGGGRE